MKMKVLNKTSPKAQISSLMLSVSLPHRYFTLSHAHGKCHKRPCGLVSRLAAVQSVRGFGFQKVTEMVTQIGTVIICRGSEAEVTLH